MEKIEKEPVLKAGDQLKNWKIVRLLGQGGMAEVYEVEDVRLGTQYALKLFTYARGEAEAARARFFDEAKLLAKLHHPRLVRVYDYGEENGHPYFVMELVLDPDGRPRTLADVGEGGADEDQVAMWYEDLRQGLEYIHGKGILHRDLKLQNVLLGPDGHVVLSDFGVAKIFSPELQADLGVSAERTLMAVRDGKQMVMGSVGYMAPEVEMGVAASKESDFYALGVLIFHLLTGVWCDARTDVAGDLETYNPVWTQILPKLLHLNPAGRACPSWRELDRAQREKEAYEAQCLVDKTRDKLTRAKRAKKVLAGVAFALCVVGVAVGGLLFRTDGVGLVKPQPTFVELFDIPDEAPLEDDENVWPCVEEFKLSRIDAWVFLGEAFDELRKKGIGLAELGERIEALAAELRENDVDESDLAGLEDYQMLGEDDVLQILLHRASGEIAKRLGDVETAMKRETLVENILKGRLEEQGTVGSSFKQTSRAVHPATGLPVAEKVHGVDGNNLDGAVGRERESVQNVESKKEAVDGQQLP